MEPSYTLLVAAKTVTLLLGAALTYLAFSAARERRSRRLHALSVGFCLVTLGSLASVAHHLAPVSRTLGLRLGSVLTAVGFAAFGYSLYATRSAAATHSGHGVR
jgi:uncharacterized membrane protein (UPF0136 family)